MNYRMKYLGITAGLALAAGSTYAAPLFSIGDTVDVFFRGSVSGTYTTNVTSSENNTADDFFFDIDPGVEIRVGRSSKAQVTLVFFETIRRYVDLTRFNNELDNLFLEGRYETGKLRTEGGFSYFESQSNSPQANLAAVNQSLVTKDNFRVDLGADYDLSPKFWVSTGFHWKGEEFTGFASTVFNDRDSYAFPIDVLYRFSPKLSVGAGYRFRLVATDDDNISLDNNRAAADTYYDHFFNLALRGEIAPKLDARVNLGYQLRTGDGNFDDEGAFSVLSGLTWQATPKLTLDAAFNRDFDTSGFGTSIEETGLNASARYQVTPRIGIRANGGYTFFDYESGREDDYWVGGLGVDYKPNNYLTFGAGYSVFFNDSNQLGSSYFTNLLSISASVRY